jgi:uncharacterized protein (TIGR03118 family)
VFFTDSDLYPGGFMRPLRKATRATTFACAAVGVAALAGSSHAGSVYIEHVLTSDGVVNAPNIDPDLINPWGASQSPAGPIWVSEQGTDKSTLYDGAGMKQSLIVDIPFNAAAPEHGPTGQAFNPSQSFPLNTGGKTGPALFIFSNLDGSISGWNPSGDATKAVKVFQSNTPATYTGMTIHTGSGGDRLYAADGLGGKIDVLDSSFQKITPSGNFSDPSVPSGLIPFNIAELAGLLYVTYAAPGENAEVAKGLGAVAAFDLDGNLVKHISDGGELTSPWGLAIAPGNFGDFSGKLLVGNFSEDFGQVNVFDQDTGKFLGTLKNAQGNPIRNPYLWSVIVGNGAAGTDPDTLYLTAGPNDETHGVFADLALAKGGGGNAIPIPPALLTAPAAGVLALASTWRARRKMLQN